LIGNSIGDGAGRSDERIVGQPAIKGLCAFARPFARDDGESVCRSRRYTSKQGPQEPIGDDVDVGSIAQKFVDRLGRAFESANKQDFVDLFWGEGWWVSLGAASPADRPEGGAISWP
jgi:hypothetical protein